MVLVSSGNLGVRFFFPVLVPFFLERATLIGSGVLVRAALSSETSYGGKNDVCGGVNVPPGKAGVNCLETGPERTTP